MASVLKDWQRAQRFLRRQAKKRGLVFSDAPDTRQQGKVRIPMPTIYWALLFGLLGGRKSGRRAEALLTRLQGWARSVVPKAVSDTTLHTEAAKLDDEYINGKLVQFVRQMKRDHMVKPSDGLLGTATCDGKNLATVDHNAGGRAHERSSENEKWQDKTRANDSSYFLAPALRARTSRLRRFQAA